MDKSRDEPTFPERLRRARDARELSQAELAALTKLQPSAISHFESGTRKPSFDNLRRLADALNVSTDFLLGRADSLAAPAQRDVIYRHYDQLSHHDQDMIRGLIDRMTEKGRKNGGDGT